MMRPKSQCTHVQWKLVPETHFAERMEAVNSDSGGSGNGSGSGSGSGSGRGSGSGSGSDSDSPQPVPWTRRIATLVLSNFQCASLRSRT